MVSAVSHTTIDSRDAYAQSEWWKQVLGYVDLPDDPNAPGHEECEITAPDRSHTVLFLQVPETKTVKNRIHFDLRPTDRTRDEEIERLRGIGAVERADLRHPDGGWVVFADPEGNEFCVLRSQAELDEEAGQQS